MIFPLLSTIFNLPSGLFSLSLLFSNCYLTLSFSFILYSTLTLRTPNSRGSQGVFLIKLCLEIELKAMTITRRHFTRTLYLSLHSYFFLSQMYTPALYLIYIPLLQAKCQRHLKRHQKACHEEAVKFPCSQCDFMATRNGNCKAPTSWGLITGLVVKKGVPTTFC